MGGGIGSPIRFPDGNFDGGRSMVSHLNEEQRNVSHASIISHRQAHPGEASSHREARGETGSPGLSPIDATSLKCPRRSSSLCVPSLFQFARPLVWPASSRTRSAAPRVVGPVLAQRREGRYPWRSMLL